MPVETLAALFVKIAFMVALGFALRKWGVIDDRLQKGLSDLLMCAVLPLSVLASAGSEFSPELAGGLGVSAVVSCVYYVLALAVCAALARPLYRRVPSRAARRPVFITMSVFANTGFIGLPVVQALYGTEGFLYGVVYNLAYQLFLFTAGIWLLSGEKRMQWRAVFTDPATLASIAAIVIYLSPFRFPVMLNDAFEEVGNMCVPLSMLVIGCCMAQVDPTRLLRERQGFLVAGLRLLVFPLLMLAVLQALRMPAMLAASCVVLTALPVGSLNVILAQRYGADETFATCAVLQSTALFAVTLPLVLLCTNAVLG